MKAQDLLLLVGVGAVGYYAYTGGIGGSSEKKKQEQQQYRSGGSANMGEVIQFMKKLNNEEPQKITSQDINGYRRIVAETSIVNSDAVERDGLKKFSGEDITFIYKDKGEIQSGTDFLKGQTITKKEAKAVSDSSKNPIISIFRSTSSHHHSSHKKKTIKTYSSFKKAVESKDDNNIRAYKSSDKTTHYIDMKKLQSVTKEEAERRNSLIGSIFNI